MWIQPCLATLLHWHSTSQLFWILGSLPSISILSLTSLGPPCAAPPAWNAHIPGIWMTPPGGYKPATSMGHEICVYVCKLESQENHGIFPGSDKRPGSLCLYPSSLPCHFSGLQVPWGRPVSIHQAWKGGILPWIMSLLPSQTRSLATLQLWVEVYRSQPLKGYCQRGHPWTSHPASPSLFPHLCWTVFTGCGDPWDLPIKLLGQGLTQYILATS